MKLTGKQIAIIAVIVVVILSLVVYGIWAYRKGKKQVTILAPPKDDPGTGTNNSYGVSSAEVSSIADALFADMDGFNWSGHDIDPYTRLNALSDTDFVRVYNRFNELHQDDGEGTLKEWLNDESYAFDDVVQSILIRMGRLGLI